MSDKAFEGRIALVTGASRGLGFAVAQALGAGGAQVIAVARTVGGLEELDDRIAEAGGPRAVLVPLDLTDGDGIDRLGAALFERFGRVDALIHCAAQGAPLTPVSHVSPKNLADQFAVNALATHRLIASIDPLLRQSENPKAVFCVDDKGGASFWGAYGASKAAAAALAESYAAEVRGVDVHLFEPPAMPTALRARTHPGEDRDALSKTTDVAADLLALLG